MAKIEPSKAIEKFKEHLIEITRLKKLNHEEGSEQTSQLNEKIRSLINVTFDDGKEKLGNYKPNPFYATYSGKSEEEEERDSQSYYERRLDMMKNYIVGYLEELELLIDTNKHNMALSKLEEQIKEEKLEAERRKAVVETKRLGAEIEIITELRNELKRKDETRKHILELNARVDSLTEKIDSIILNPLAFSHVQNAHYVFQEDQWYEDILKRLENVQLPKKDVLLKAIKKNYAEMKMHRQQIDEVQKKLTLKPSLVEEVALKNHVGVLENELTDLMTRMAGFWTEYS